MKLSTGINNLGGKDRLENMDIAYEAGFRHFDYSFGEYRTSSGFYADYEGHMKRIKAKMAELGVDFVLSHAPSGKPFRSEEDWKLVMDVTKVCLRACHELNIPATVAHSGYVANISKEECFERNRKFFREILAEAEKYGIFVLVENYDKMVREDTYWVDNAPDLRDMVDYIDHPLCRACWDAGHANLQEMPQHQALALLGNRVMATHIQDNKGDKDTHLYPYYGTLNLDSLMQGLINIGYKGTFNFETAMMFTEPKKRRPFDGEQRLAEVPRNVRAASQKMLYEIGKTTLQAYNLFED